jgi:archaellin
MIRNHGNIGITTGILLVIFILISAVAASVIVNNTYDTSNLDLTKITNQTIDEITTYLQVKNVVGKYENIQGKQTIQKIGILVKPLVSVDIDTAKLRIMISNGEDLRVLSNSGHITSMDSSSLFNNPLWDSINEDTFSMITITDDDSSLEQYHTMNKYTDTAFIIFSLPTNATLDYGGTLQLTIMPSPGIQRTITLEPPLPTTHVVSLYGE